MSGTITWRKGLQLLHEFTLKNRRSLIEIMQLVNQIGPSIMYYESINHFDRNTTLIENKSLATSLNITIIIVIK